MVLLQQQHRDPAWNGSLAAYWRSLPPRGRVYTKEAFTDAHLRLLQDARLVRAARPPRACRLPPRAAASRLRAGPQADYARLHRTWTREVHAGLRAALAGARVPLPEFVHATALVRRARGRSATQPACCAGRQHELACVTLGSCGAGQGMRRGGPAAEAGMRRR